MGQKQEPEPAPVRLIYRKGFWTNHRDLAKLPVATLLFNRKRGGAAVRARVRARARTRARAGQAYLSEMFLH